MYKSLLRRHLYSLQAGKARLETDQKASTIGSSNVEVSIKHSKFLRSLLGITHLPSSSNSNQNHLLILTSRQVGTKLSQIIRPFFSHSSTSTTYFKMISSKVLSALFLTLLPVVSALENAPGVPADSILVSIWQFHRCFQTLTSEPFSFFQYYSPSVVGAVVFGVVYILASIFLFINTWAWKDWYALALPVGAFFQGVGFFVRIPYRDQPGGIGLYIIQDLFIVLAPACCEFLTPDWAPLSFLRHGNQLSFAQSCHSPLHFS